MKIYYCYNLKELPASFVFPFLKILVFWGCNNLTYLPVFDSRNSLETLQVGRCPLLEGIPNIEPLTNLCRLEIHNCMRMTNVPQGLASLCNLTELEIGPLCQDLDFFPFPEVTGSCAVAKSLQSLCFIGWPKVGNLPDELQHFTQLQRLTISHFARVKFLPNWLGNLTCLRTIVLEGMENLIWLPSKNMMQKATKFVGFSIKPYQCPKLKEEWISGHN